jgi:hypothetical protein
MAWKARIVAKDFSPAGVTHLHIAYFEETVPEIVLAGHNFNFKPGTTRLEMLQVIRSKGRELQQKYEQHLARRAELDAEEQAAIAKSKNAFENIVVNSEVTL